MLLAYHSLKGMLYSATLLLCLHIVMKDHHAMMLVQMVQASSAITARQL